MLIKTFKLILINVVVLLILLVIFELILGSWLKKNNFQSLLIPKHQFNIIQNIPYKSNKIGIFSRDKYGFRANNYKLKDIEILILGGSTTEERDVDDNLIWSKVFEGELKSENRKVLNAGIGGQTSYGHSKIYDLWLSRYAELNPEIILVYVGINDALFFVEQFLNNNYSVKGRVINNSNRDLLNLEYSQDRFIQYFKNNSIIHDLYLLIKGNILSRKYKLNYNKTPKVFNEKYTKIPDIKNKPSLETINLFHKYYENNILNIKKISQKYNSKIIFVTQKIAKDHWLYNYLSIVNKISEKICNEQKLECFNLHKNINFNIKKDLYDGIHTTPDGSHKIGKKIAKYFNDNNL